MMTPIPCSQLHTDDAAVRRTSTLDCVSMLHVTRCGRAGKEVVG